MNKLNKICVAGGGTAGFVSALILKTRFPHIDIEVVRSTDIGIVGVGEGSTEHWSEFIKYIGVDWRDVILECNATFKSGIMFRGWSDKDYLHSTSPDYDISNGQYPYVYGHIMSSKQPCSNMNPKRTWDSRIPTWQATDPSADAPYNQYHFDTNKLNDFLVKVAINKGITVIDDIIVDAVINDNGNITSLAGEKSSYTADFFIDCTGFRKILISKLGASWKSYDKYLKMKSAIMFPTESLDNYPLWTIAQTMDYGWMFSIPVQTRTGNGYIFDSDYITADQAKDEIDRFFNKDIEVARKINFTPGCLDKVWINNCCAVGLSANFVEPLEATSIGTSIQQIFLLMHRLPNYNQTTINDYNKDVNDIMTNIRDFVIMHYLTKKNNSNFWKDIQSMPIPDSLAEKLERWKYNLPIEDDFRGITKYALFNQTHHIHVLNGLKLFDQTSIESEFNMMHPWIKNNAINVLAESMSYDEQTPLVTHSQFINYIKELYGVKKIA